MGFTNPPLMTPLSTDMTPSGGSTRRDTEVLVCGLNGMVNDFVTEKTEKSGFCFLPRDRNYLQ